MTRRPAITLLAFAGLAGAQTGAQTAIGVQAAGRAEADSVPRPDGFSRFEDISVLNLW